ncbi:MAG: amidohydrolase family protein [Bacteroidales bacterium]|nr:amidohydrolase family protein [Bacteroidales bacterium]
MIILKNITLIDSISFKIEKGHLLIDSLKDGAYHFVDENGFPENAEIVECEGQIAMKAFANGHHHAYSTLARGMPFNSTPPKNFVEILEKVWWKLDKELTADMNEISAYYTAISSAKNGVASVIDHHASPFAIKGSLKKMEKAFTKTGVDPVLCYEISDRDGPEVRDQGLEETADFLKDNQGLVGLHAAFTLSNDSLKKAADIAQSTNSGIHIHLAEDTADQEDSLQKHNKRVTERLAEYGFLEMPKSIFAHGIHLSNEEKEMLAKSPAFMVQNPESNLNNQVGYFNGEGLGKNIMLGTDGMHSNMIRSAQTALFTGQNYENIDMVEAYQRLRNVNTYLETQFNNSGHALTILDFDAPTPIHEDNFLGHFFFGFENSQVQHLINHGRFIVKDRQIMNLDEEIIKKEARKLALQLWDKL